MVASLKSHATEFYLKFSNPINNVLYIILMIAIVYVSQIPESYKKYGNNMLVRAGFFGLIIATNNYISYMHALLLALFFVLYLSFSPGFIESFEDLRIVAKKESRWYDEKVLGEEPDLMETEKVQTQAIQSS